ncbi:fatty-acid amide hydrolase 2 isoform X2 [Nilaparvata lugens]|uniref:fatty-acid amide hydrolase 2 isoform X2 n=2 Tax=Nilaparvata lugens TaxID=108931 RepID=UPI00193D4729|nr:fatty-acid amide hydrolase 2 isoform X2 [Nilaparvata lugens]
MAVCTVREDINGAVPEVTGSYQQLPQISTGACFYLVSKKDVVMSGTKYQKISNALNLESATKLTKKVRTGEVRSEDLVGAFGFRARRVQVLLNAVVEERYDKAAQDGYLADQLVNTGEKTETELAKEKPLLGIPISISEACKVEGMSYSIGSVIRQGRKADRDGRAVALLKKAGAIPLVVSNQPEFGLGAETYNHVTGRTANPYCRQRSVGGASGGEATLISSGASVIGLGTDFGGSIQIPAMFAGVFGHKPTPGLISSEGHYAESTDEPYGNRVGVGPLVRYAEDLPLLISVLADEKAPLLKLKEPVDMGRLRVLYIDEPTKSFGMPKISKEIQQLIKKAANHLSTSCGCQTQMMRFKQMEHAPEISSAILFSIKSLPDVFSEVDTDNPKMKPNVLLELVKSLFGLSRHTTGALHFSLLKHFNCMLSPSKTEQYIKEGEQLKTDLVECLSEDGVILFPTFPTAAYYHRESAVRTLDFSYSALISAMGLPATHVPMGLNSKGLPIGIQVVAAPYKDRLCFAVAKELERAFGGWVPPSN